MEKNIYKKKKIKFIKNKFWKDVLEAWVYFSGKKNPELICNTAMEPLFHNPNIKIGKKIIFYNKWYEKNITCVNDLLNQDGSFMNPNTFNTIYSMNVHFLEYRGILAAVKEWMRKKDITLTKQYSPYISQIFILYLKQKNQNNCMKY